MPRAWAPMRSDWMPMRFRSRQVKWRIVSIPTWVEIMDASAIDDIRTRAMGESATLMVSTPARRNRSAPSIIFFGRAPRGGSTSTLTTNSRSASFRERRLRDAGSAGGSGSSTMIGVARPVPRDVAAIGAPKSPVAPGCATPPDAARARRASRIFRVWSGVVPQQPPIRSAPASAKRQARAPRYSGEER